MNTPDAVVPEKQNIILFDLIKQHSKIGATINTMNVLKNTLR